MVICKLAQANPCSGVDVVDGVCDVLFPAGVLARNERFGCCAFQDTRAKKVGQAKAKVNPLKAAKRG